jgi:hypothetical protein
MTVPEESGLLLGRERESGVARVVMKHPGNGEHTRDEESNHYYPTSEP